MRLGPLLRTIVVHLVLVHCLLLSGSAQDLPGRPIKLIPRVGDAVEVKFLGEWYLGTATAVNNNSMEVAFTWSGREKVSRFKLVDSRYPWQADVISPAFVWKDASGDHSIRAAVRSLDREKRTVTLYKIDDGRSVTMKFDQLGTLEQRRIKILLERENTRVQSLPPVLSFGTASKGLAKAGLFTSAVSYSDLTQVQPDPPAVTTAVPPGGASFAKLNFHEDLIGVYPIGSSAGWILGATGPGSFSSDLPSRLVWATLSNGRVVTQHALDPKQKAIAVHAASQQVLTVGRDDDRAQTLTLYRSSPKIPAAKPTVRFLSGSATVFDEMWGDFIDGDRVIHRIDRGEYAVYQVSSQRMLYTIEQQSFFKAEPVLSPGHHYLALPEDEGVRVLRAADGVTVANLPINGGSTSGVAFDSAGNRLAVLTRNELAIWDLGSASPPKTYRADSIGSPFARSLAWVDDRLLLIGGEILYSLDSQMPVWKYKSASFEVLSSSFNPNTVSVANGRLAYAAELRQGRDTSFVIGAVELPGPLVQSTIEQVDFDGLYVLQPGGRVRLMADCGTYDDRVYAAMEQIASANRWEVSLDAPLTLVATMGRYPRQTTKYRKVRGNEEQTVTTEPYFSKLELIQGEDVLWSAATSSGGLGPFVMVRDNESLQSKARQYERPVPGFFDQTDVPEKIFNRRFGDGFGTSTYGLSGLKAVVKPGLPIK